jgi:virginiamycin B lyase
MSHLARIFAAAVLLGASLSFPLNLGAQTVGLSQVILPPAPPGSLSAIDSENSIAAGPDGSLWVTGLMGYSTVARVAPDGTVSTFTVPWPFFSAVPDNITPGPDGAMWFTARTLGGSGGAICRITMEGAITTYMLSESQVIGFGGLTAGPDGALWFLAAIDNVFVGRITTDGVLTEYPTELDEAIGGITVGPDNALWFGSTTSIGRINTDGTMTLYPIPSAPADAWGITAGSDGALWFVENYSNKIGRVTTEGEFTEYPIPTPNSDSVSIAAGPGGDLWFTESATGKIGIANASGVREIPAPITGFSPWWIVQGPGGYLWFTAVDPVLANQANLIQLVNPTAVLTADPISGGAAKPITLSGSGFAPGETIQISVNNKRSGMIESVPANGTGSFELNVRLGEAPAGVASIFAVGTTSQKTGIADFRVSPVLVLPATAPAGSSISIEGFGFSPRESVSIGFLGGYEICSIPANQFGSFFGSEACMYSVPAGATPGTYAIEGRGETSNVRTAAAMTIE